MAKKNYFTLLEIPANANTDQIKEAINKKKSQWQAETKNPRKQIQARKNISNIPEIERIMLDDDLREIERQKFVQVSKRIQNDIHNKISILETRGYITKEELSDLLNEAKGSLTKEEVISMIHVDIALDDHDNINNNISITKEEKQLLESYFRSLSIDDMSLYNFYKVNKDSNMVQVAQKELSTILQKGQKDLSDEIRQKIAGLTKSIFQNNKIGYDNFLKGNRFINLNSYIKSALIDNKIKPESYLAIQNIAKSEYGMSEQTFKNYIENNAKDNGFEIDSSISMLILLSNMNQNREEAKEQQAIDTSQKEEDNVVDEEAKKRQNITDFIKKTDDFVKDVFTKTENNMKIIKSNFEKPKMLSNTLSYVIYAVAAGIATYNVLDFKKLDDFMQNISLFLFILIIAMSGYTYWIRKKSQELEVLYKKCNDLNKSAINNNNKYNHFDRSVLYNGNQSDFDMFTGLANSINSDFSAMATHGQDLLNKIKKYPKKPFHLYILGGAILTELIIVAYPYITQGIQSKGIGWWFIDQ